MTKEKICLLTALSFLMTQHAFSYPLAQQLGYEPLKVELRGVVVVQEFFGPPNFGDTPSKDKKVHFILIKLDHPVEVVPKTKLDYNNDSFSDVKEIEMIAVGPQDLKKYVGRHVIISGVLYERQNYRQYTDVLVMTENIRLLEK